MAMNPFALGKIGKKRGSIECHNGIPITCIDII